MIRQFSRVFLQGLVFGFGVLAAGLFAVTVSGTVSTFNSGDLISATSLNTNFASLKTAIENVPDHLAARVRQSSNQTIANNTTTTLSWDTTDFDTGSFYSAGTPDRLTIPSDGIYRVTANVAWTHNTTGIRSAYVKVNGGNDVLVDSCDPETNGATYINMTGIQKFNAGDYIQFSVYQTSGSGLTLATSLTDLGLMIEKISN